MPTIEELEIADEPVGVERERASTWRTASARCRACGLRLAGKGDVRGIVGWTARATRTRPRRRHRAAPERGRALDHVVMLSPDLDRTVAELEQQGFDLRRVREGPTPGGSTRQAFFRAGEPILEVVQAPEGTSVARDPDGPARLWGLAFTVEDLDESAPGGSGTCSGRRATRSSRAGRIATLRPAAGLGPAMAFMTPGRGDLSRDSSR